MDEEKPHVKVLILGNFDCGKTTLAGHLIYRCGIIDKRIFDRFEQEANEAGKRSFKYAWLCSQLDRTPKRDPIIHTPSWNFETNKNRINLIDESGNRDFLQRIITRIPTVNCVLLVMPAIMGEFEASMSKCSIVYKQILAAYCMGIEHMIIAVSKMDKTDPPYSKDRFNEIRMEVTLYLKRMGYQPQNVVFLPISALAGDNLIEPSNNMSWSTDHIVTCEGKTTICRTLLEALDNIVLPSRPITKPLRLSLEAVYKRNGETLVAAFVETGVLKPEMVIQFIPSYLSAKVKSIEMHYETLEKAGPGNRVIFSVDGVNKYDLRDDLIASDSTDDPAGEALHFTAQVIILYHPNHIGKGFRCTVFCHKTQVACEFTEFLEKIDRKSDEVIERNPEFLKTNEVALVKMTPSKAICVEKFIDYPPLGSFVVYGDKIIAIGIIKHVAKKGN